MQENSVVMTAGELKELKVWSAVCKQNKWRESFLEGKISDDMRFQVDADLLGSVTNFIVSKYGLYLQAFDEELANCKWSSVKEEALVFDNLNERAIQKAFNNHGHGMVTGRLV